MLWQTSLSEHYRKMPAGAIAEAIEQRRRRLGESLVILGHHYQADEVIQHADLTGDSLKLSQQAARVAAERDVRWVVFCGVHFMAESADLLTPKDVDVILPDLSAGCSMADMADFDDAVDAWHTLHDELARQGWTGRVVPVTYVNSSAAIKAFVGEHGGACCTSSNADRVFEWAMRGGTHPGSGDDIKLLFLPDQHLGRNTAAKHGMDVRTQTAVYDPKLARAGESLGGMTSEQLADARAVLWAGHCSVHKLFRPEHCDELRKDDAEHPDRPPTTILVHPECAKEVVDKSDLAGSTEYIIEQIENAEPGSRWAVGTEVHLVNRLARQAAERGVFVRILSDCQCLCTTMYRIDPPHLLWILDGLCGENTEGGSPVVRNIVRVPDEVRGPALESLDRMLDLSTPMHQPG